MPDSCPSHVTTERDVARCALSVTRGGIVMRVVGPYYGLSRCWRGNALRGHGEQRASGETISGYMHHSLVAVP